MEAAIQERERQWRTMQYPFVERLSKPPNSPDGTIDDSLLGLWHRPHSIDFHHPPKPHRDARLRLTDNRWWRPEMPAMRQEDIPALEPWGLQPHPGRPGWNRLEPTPHGSQFGCELADKPDRSQDASTGYQLPHPPQLRIEPGAGEVETQAEQVRRHLEDVRTGRWIQDPGIDSPILDIMSTALTSPDISPTPSSEITPVPRSRASSVKGMAYHTISTSPESTTPDVTPTPPRYTVGTSPEILPSRKRGSRMVIYSSSEQSSDNDMTPRKGLTTVDGPAVTLTTTIPEMRDTREPVTGMRSTRPPMEVTSSAGETVEPASPLTQPDAALAKKREGSPPPETLNTEKRSERISDQKLSEKTATKTELQRQAPTEDAQEGANVHAVEEPEAQVPVAPPQPEVATQEQWRPWATSTPIVPQPIRPQAMMPMMVVPDFWSWWLQQLPILQPPQAPGPKEEPKDNKGQDPDD